MKNLLVEENWIFSKMVDKNKELKCLEPIEKLDDIGVFAQKCFDAMKQLKSTPEVVENTDVTSPSIQERNYILSLVYIIGVEDAKGEKQKGDDFFLLSASEFFVNGETTKYISLDDPDVKKTCEDLEFSITEKGIQVIPDLVIHNSHNPKSAENKDNQVLVIEAKTTRTLGRFAFMKDFFKLNAYMAELQFQKAIYLIVNTGEAKVDDMIEEYINSKYFLFEHRRDSLFFFIQESIDSEPKVYKLK